LDEGDESEAGSVNFFGPDQARRLSSYSAIAPAMATLSDSPPPGCGILGGQAFPLGTENEHHIAVDLELGQRRAAARDERDAPPGRLVEARERDAEDRAHRGAHRLRAGRICTALRERDTGAERIGGADQRPDVPRIRDAPEGKRDATPPTRQVIAAENTDNTRRMRERRHLREQSGLCVLACDENVGRLEASAEAGFDEILALDREQPELLAPAPVLKLAEELESLVVARRDQSRSRR